MADIVQRPLLHPQETAMTFSLLLPDQFYAAHVASVSELIIHSILMFL